MDAKITLRMALVASQIYDSSAALLQAMEQEFPCSRCHAALANSGRHSHSGNKLMEKHPCQELIHSGAGSSLFKTKATLVGAYWSVAEPCPVPMLLGPSLLAPA